MADASRDRMLGEIASGSDKCGQGDGDMSGKTILCRGCDPVMAEKAGKMLPPFLGNAALVSCTNDSDFFQKLQERKFDVIFFAPGACRFSAAGQAIPGGNSSSQGWGLEQYREKVKEHQGADVTIVETTQESEIVSLLRAGLGLPAKGAGKGFK
mmetsp:Transcript_7937/g.12820  ORF Transcript_7937/g.12820 Transcript_7937/m.12820 type:complete len:154 (-) Transcript_7937:31-492(-)